MNTGWVGCNASSGAARISLPITRQIIHAILDGSIQQSECLEDPYFGFQVPITLADIDPGILVPKSAWEDVNEYTSTARVLVQKFQDNFKQYDQGDEVVNNAGPTID